jgi:predicted helicase
MFPLYLYGAGARDISGGRRPNLNPAFVGEMASKLGLRFVPDGKGDLERTFGPEDVFHYIYAVFHSPTYRQRYAEFLKIDFPRVPLTSDRALFAKLCVLGERLTKLHLMEEGGAGAAVSFPVRGHNTVESVRYTAPGEGGEKGRVWINKEQFFEGVPPEVWEFHIGGYQVAEKWLKDRKGRTLTLDDREHYRGIVAALYETGRLMGEVDGAIGEWPVK